MGTCTVCLCFALIGSQGFIHEYTSPISTCAGLLERFPQKGNKSYQVGIAGISSDKIQILSTCDNGSEVTKVSETFCLSNDHERSFKDFITYIFEIYKFYQNYQGMKEFRMLKYHSDEIKEVCHD